RRIPANRLVDIRPFAGHLPRNSTQSPSEAAPQTSKKNMLGFRRTLARKTFITAPRRGVALSPKNLVHSHKFFPFKTASRLQPALAPGPPSELNARRAGLRNRGRGTADRPAAVRARGRECARACGVRRVGRD